VVGACEFSVFGLPVRNNDMLTVRVAQAMIATKSILLFLVFKKEVLFVFYTRSTYIVLMLKKSII